MKKSVEIDPEVIAETAGLTYVSNVKPGFSRKPVGKHFKFYDLQGKEIKDPDEIDRIRKLAIPPAYKDVWICPKKWTLTSHRPRRKGAKTNILAAITEIAKKLGNTISICRKCYIHPEVLLAYQEGALIRITKSNSKNTYKLNAEEKAVLNFLKKRLKKKVID